MRFKLTRRARTLEKFLSLVDRYQCDRVILEPYIYEKTVSHSWAVGTIGTFEHGIKYRATGPKTKIVYKERLQETFGSSRGIADAPKRSRNALKDMVTAKSRRDHLMFLRPSLKVIFMTSHGPLSSELERELDENAKSYQVTPYALSS